jgi:hypothetical protein
MVRTMAGERNLRSSNSCVTEEYYERDNALAKATNYGRVKAMFLHKFGELEDIIVECEWYEVVGINPTKLTQIRRNANYDGCLINFLKNLFPTEMVFWPSDITNPGNGLLDVIRHHS